MPAILDNFWTSLVRDTNNNKNNIYHESHHNQGINNSSAIFQHRMAFFEGNDRFAEYAERASCDNRTPHHTSGNEDPHRTFHPVLPKG